MEKGGDMFATLFESNSFYRFLLATYCNKEQYGSRNISFGPNDPQLQYHTVLGGWNYSMLAGYDTNSGLLLIRKFNL